MSRRVSYEAWTAEGKRRFGDDPLDWQFACPCCGHVATGREYELAGAPSGAVGYSCIGRWSGARREAFGGGGPGPCNYAGGGLFAVHPLQVEVEGRSHYPCFEFAEVAP